MKELTNKLFDIETAQIAVLGFIFNACLFLLAESIVDSFDIPAMASDLFIQPIKIIFMSSLVIVVLLLTGNIYKLLKGK